MLLAARICALPVSAKEPEPTPLVAEVLSAPMRVPASDGRRYLVYGPGFANATKATADHG
jgi:hypothetical protein